MEKYLLGFTVVIALALSGPAKAQQPNHAGEKPTSIPVRVRGTVQSVSGKVLTLTTNSGVVRLQLSPTIRYAELVPSDKDHVKPGSFLGITSVTQPDGSQRAVEIHVFPEAMRGSGEGSYPWDWPGTAGSHSAPHSRMTNGTVSAGTPSAALHSRMTNGTVSNQTGGSRLTLKYKGAGGAGEQPITIPAGIPIVTFAPGTVQDLKPGAHVFIIADKQVSGALTAQRVMVGKNGMTPPM
jgi:hypothetical protein